MHRDMWIERIPGDPAPILVVNATGQRIADGVHFRVIRDEWTPALDGQIRVLHEVEMVP